MEARESANGSAMMSRYSASVVYIDGDGQKDEKGRHERRGDGQALLSDKNGGGNGAAHPTRWKRTPRSRREDRGQSRGKARQKRYGQERGEEG